MTEKAKPYAFNRGKPFYPIMMSYIFQLHAISDLVLHGIPGVNRKFELIPELDNDVFKSAIEKLAGPLNLEVTGDQDRINLHIKKTATELFNNHRYLVEYQVIAASHCLVMGYEITKDKGYRTNDPIWEFLRHCRNAVAHGGKFHFLGNEPKNKAEWRGITIDRQLEGTPLMKGDNGVGKLNLGDPIALLWDIESAYPAMII